MKLSQDIFDCIVIGGGASGMMAAVVAASRGKKVLILEKNNVLGKKLKISGGGRCNITNAEYDTRVLLKNYGAAEQFLYSPFSKFGVKETFSFFEFRNLPLVVQARKRAFPHTEKAHDVYKILEQELKKHSVFIKTNTEVKKINTENKRVTSLVTNNGTYIAKSYVLATGGVSHPETGSTGDGFKWLKALGHTIKDPTPSIVPLATSDKWIHALAGVSLSFMKITFFLEGKKRFSKTGKILFTHFGLSGPLILNLAGLVSGLLENGHIKAEIDAFPDTDKGTLEKRLIALFDANKNKILKTVFKEFAPLGTADAIMTLFPEIKPDAKVHSITKEERKTIVETLKALPVTITHLMGYDRAVVADGGVPLSEIDTRSMRSKLFDNLYITGDLLHINRPSGGFSLQLCWTTGFVAGSSVD